MSRKLEADIEEYAEQHGKDAKNLTMLIHLVYSILNDYCLTKNEEVFMSSKQFVTGQLKAAMA